MDDAFIYTSRGPYRQYKLLVRGERVTGFDTIPHRTPRREGFRRVKAADGQLGRTAAFRLLQRPQSWRVDILPRVGLSTRAPLVFEHGRAIWIPTSSGLRSSLKAAVRLRFFTWPSAFN